MSRPNPLSEGEIFEILANGRRRETLRHLTETRDGAVTLSSLAIAIATAESGQSPPPPRVRESVWSSLHQTHLPKLDELGVVRYDSDSGIVTLCDQAREIYTHMEIFAWNGLSWSELYRGLGIGSLLAVLAVLLEAPFVGSADPILAVSVSLAMFAAAAAAQLWPNRLDMLRALRRS
ncbi:hypothetical protein [Natrialba sp. INN-245]|uniref:DUF7344 domain-containing protein n=1 Tax=Natrialba sp. INN-245 TaxID=2690967 RepID=UPI001311CA17|nr:hypothetical protein [Natrialba sp. INN-245]MWV41692.1 hypothetical protein [Natrialba sp. INN-245]